MSMMKTRWAPECALLLSAAVWGGSYLAAKVLVSSIPAVVVLSLRFIPSAVLLLGLTVVNRYTITRQVVCTGLALGSILAVALFLETEAVTRTSASNAGVIISLTIVITPVIEGMLGRNRLPITYFVATLTAICGVMILIGPHGLTTPNLGDLLVLTAVFMRSAFVIASSYLTADRNVSVIAISAVQAAFNAVFFTALNVPGMVATASRLTASQWGVIAFLSVGCTLLAFLLQLWAIRRTSATHASLLSGTEPVWAVFAGTVIGGESMTISTVIGSIIVIASTIWGQQIEIRKRDGKQPEQVQQDARPATARAPAQSRDVNL
jgi:drug/metabolite transporter (DMT)-like permease